MASLSGKTLFISGASRGIGLAIGLRAAQDGANIVIAAKTSTPHAKLPGTIHTAAEEVRQAGGAALALECDIRFEQQIEAAVARTVETFGGIDICVNNASAISLTATLQTDPRRYDLMHQINGRGTFMVSRACIPHLRRAANPHVLMLSPPLNLVPRWFAPYPAYALSKYSMSIYAMAMAEEFRTDGIAFNTLWPRTIIATAAVRNLLGGDEAIARSRTPQIVADAAHAILTRHSREFTGRHCIDDEVLLSAGVTDLEAYRSVPGPGELAPDLFVADVAPTPPGAAWEGA
jgi:citronellol/citronellal dehydrogenase